MMAVWKFPLNLAQGPQALEMPVGATIVHVHAQGHSPCLWAAVDPKRGRERRTFRLYATGEEITVPVHHYVGTVHIEWTVWHVYEDVS